MKITGLNRLPAASTPEARAEFAQTFNETLTALGVAPGDEFLLAHPAVLEERRAHAGDADTATLAEARDWLRDRVDAGATCPCCRQLAKVYRRKMTHVAAAALIWLLREGGTAHIPSIVNAHIPRYAHQGGVATLGAYWGLMAEVAERRDDGGRAGWWTITADGTRFARGEMTVPKYAHTYDGRVLSHSGPPMTVVEALGEYFDYRELMAGLAA